MNSQGKDKSRRSFSDFLVHIHPPTVPEETLRFTLSWGLGGMSAMLIFLLFGSGILQLLTYEPSVSGAYTSVMAMYTPQSLAGWIRNIHHWSANLLVIFVVLHLMRVFLTGAIGPGRRLNWIIGLVLLFFVLCANFSGYLLPWDQLAYWAVTICTSMMAYFPGIGNWVMALFRGGNEVGPATLSNFYALHIAFIPGSLLLLMIWHFWLVRRSGGLIRATEKPDSPTKRVPSVPELIVREAAIGLSLVAVVLIISVFLNAPLDEQANPGLSPNPAKAPWYFLGFQELLLHLHPVFAICVFPVLASLALVCLPFWRGAVLPGGTWFGGQRGQALAMWSFIGGILISFLLVFVDENLLRAGKGVDGIADIVSRGYLPLFIFMLVLAGGLQLLVLKFRFSRAHAVMAGMMFSFAVLAAMTIIGIWFRGQGMQLFWPWS
ncbi:MAG: cytochrome b N-terminal domain-containing protein [Desulfobulbaceae bacterium]|nr:cytochrome b N-terminal domain-containing protein [Desulfobulbaceae bacterium]